MHATYRAPADTEIAAYTFWRSVQLGSPYNYRYYELTRDGALQYDTCYPSSGCTSKGSTSSPLGSSNRVSVSNRTGVSGLQFSTTCGLQSGTCTATAPGARFQLHRADITLLDRTSPVISSPPTGPLVQAGAPLAGVASVSLAATDRGGGVHEALFEVDGRLVGRATLDANGGLCRPPYTVSVPCKLSASGTVGFDTRAVPDGTHSLRILVTDATGTNSAAWGPITIRTANATCNPEPRVSGLRVSARIAPRRRAVTTRYGRKVRVRGRVATPDGKPAAGVPLCVAFRDQVPSASVRPARTIVTDARGRFTTVLKPGPSRRVWFVHRVPSGAVAASVFVNVRAPVRLQPSRRFFRNGELLVLRGRLKARARRGVLVELQARRPGGWQTFGVTRTRRAGRFSFPYRFTRTSGVQLYRMRARVPRQSVYPFAAGASRPIAVRVAG
jgi:hypothetical protein